jgi:beta-phosphoglucomutase
MTLIALLFDLDGTLVDTDHLHHAAFAALLGERGVELSLSEYRHGIMGQPNHAIMARYFPGEEAEHAAIADRKEAMFRGSLATSVEPVAGIGPLLDWAENTGAGTAVVTNAPRANAEAVLAAAGLAGRLGTLVFGDECPAPKPDPAPYLEAMRRLGVAADNAVAFEDSASGIAAARGSGAHVFGLSTGLDPEALRAAGAHDAIADFTAPALWAHLDSMGSRAA